MILGKMWVDQQCLVSLARAGKAEAKTAVCVVRWCKGRGWTFQRKGSALLKNCSRGEELARPSAVQTQGDFPVFTWRCGSSLSIDVFQTCFSHEISNLTVPSSKKLMITKPLAPRALLKAILRS